MFLLLPLEEIDLAFDDIIEDLINRNEKYLKWRDNIVWSSMEDGLFRPCFWNWFGLIVVGRKSANELEGCHPQLHSYGQTHGNLLTWIRFIQESEESAMVRVAEEHTQQRPRRLTSITNENIWIQAKQDYFDGLLALKHSQQRFRALGYRYMNVFDRFDKDELDYQPEQS